MHSVVIKYCILILVLLLLLYFVRQFFVGEEEIRSVDIDGSWVLDRTRAEIDLILRKHLEKTSSRERFAVPFLRPSPATELVGRQETWLILYGGVEQGELKSDLHVVICSKELRNISESSDSGVATIAAETLSDWKFESYSPRVGGNRSPFRYRIIAYL